MSDRSDFIYFRSIYFQTFGGPVDAIYSHNPGMVTVSFGTKAFIFCPA